MKPVQINKLLPRPLLKENLKTLSKKASCTGRIVRQTFAETKQKVSQFNNKCLPMIYIDQRPKKRPMTHQISVIAPKNGCKKTLHYSTRQDNKPNWSPTQRKTWPSTDNYNWACQISALRQLDNIQSCKNLWIREFPGVCSNGKTPPK